MCCLSVSHRVEKLHGKKNKKQNETIITGGANYSAVPLNYKMCFYSVSELLRCTFFFYYLLRLSESVHWRRLFVMSQGAPTPVGPNYFNWHARGPTKHRCQQTKQNKTRQKQHFLAGGCKRRAKSTVPRSSTLCFHWWCNNARLTWWIVGW